MAMGCGLLCCLITSGAYWLILFVWFLCLLLVCGCLVFSLLGILLLIEGCGGLLG